jgi:uncharacterized membrane protein YeaQ/YmgE (transglycosylase-associated protein family)
VALEEIIVWLVIGAIAGWLLPRIGFVLVGGVAAIINAVIGAVILLFVIGLFKKAA